MSRWPDLTLVERLWQKIVRGPGNQCWGWTAGMSRSGRREVRYPNIREGAAGSFTWRVNRLLLVLRDGPVDVPADDAEPFLLWLARARRYYRNLGVEASHSCDNSECCNPGHLLWESHADNIKRQKAREHARRAQETKVA